MKRIKELKILKVDIESSEYDVFSNIDGIFFKKINYLVIELHMVYNIFPEGTYLFKKITKFFNIIKKNIPSVLKGKKLIELIFVNKRMVN